MAFILKDIIFKLFGVEEKLSDTYKDAQKEGIFERYNKSLAEDFDTNINPYIDDLIDNTIVPQLAMEKLLAPLEAMLGDILRLKDTSEYRRKILRFFNRIYSVKGTSKGYEILFKMLGFETVEIVVHFAEYGLDSAITLDDPKRRLDSGCPMCLDYTLNLTGDVSMDEGMLKSIGSAVVFLQPIDMKLRAVNINGDVLDLNAVVMYVDEFGDLIYSNENDPLVEFELVNGDLIANGSNADDYDLSDNGDLMH
jgi:hypothetical protein